MNKALAKAHRLAMQHRAAAVAARRHGLSAGATVPLFAKKSEQRGELFVYQQIGGSWFSEGITAESVRKALAEMKGVKSLHVYINSEGGDVFEAKAIYTQLQRFESEKVVHVDGIAASAASFIAMAGDRIISSPVATVMIHNPWTVAMGEAADMRATADILDLEAQTLAETYAKQTGSPVAEMLELMAAETWMNATEALERGFIDEVDEDETDDDEAETEALASPLIAAAARTQQLIKSVSPAQLLAARAEMHRRNHPGQPGTTLPASR